MPTSMARIVALLASCLVATCPDGPRKLSGGCECVGARRCRLLVGSDGGFARERPRDVVEAVNQRLARVVVKLERDAKAVRVRDLERLEVDRQLVPLGDRGLDPR